MEKIILLIAACFCLNLLSSQTPMEYIPNGGFEKFKEDKKKGVLIFRKPEKQVRFGQLKFWENPTDLAWPQATTQKATPDFYRFINGERPDDDAVQSKYAIVKPFGTSTAGIMVFNGQSVTDANYREYLTVKLNKDLEVGQSYTIRFLITNGEKGKEKEVFKNYGKYGITNLGILLSEKLPIQKEYGLIKTSPQIVIEELIYTDSWKEIVLSIEADQPYSFLTIGNFNDDYDFYSGATNCSYQIVETDNKNAKGNHCYYFFDNFSLKKSQQNKKEIASTFSSNTRTLNGRKVVSCGNSLILPNLLFGKDQSTFRKDKKEAAYEELDNIYRYAAENEHLIVEISGHTQYIQDPASRDTLLNLSHARAETAMKYLVDKGLSELRIIAVGLGPDYPYDLNNDEVNRRVMVSFLCEEDIRSTPPINSPVETQIISEAKTTDIEKRDSQNVQILNQEVKSLLIEDPHNSLSAKVGQVVKFGYIKQIWSHTNFKEALSTLIIREPYVVEEVRQDVKNYKCEGKPPFINDWYRISWSENGKKENAWICDLSFINSGCY